MLSFMVDFRIYWGMFMNRKIWTVISVFLLICLAGCSSWQPKDTRPYELNKRLNPGLNIGNALEAPNEGDWGVYIKDEYLPLIKAAGFNSIRLPICWSAHADLNPPYTISAEFMERVKHIVESALKNNLIVIINVQHFQDIYTDPAPNLPRLLAFWRQIGTTFKDFPTTLLFEPLNEPHFNMTPELWNEYLPVIIDSIRVTNPNRTLVIGTADWGGIWQMRRLKLPPNERNLILSIHYYEPFRFTHQGAEWEKASKDWLGMTWTNTESQMQELNRHFDQIKKFADSLAVPVTIGEYGCYHRVPDEYRLLWTNAISKQCQTYEFSRAYWEFCAGFGIFDTTANQWRESLLRAVVNPQ